MEEKINHLEQNIDQLNYEIGMRKSELRNKEDSVNSVERQLEDTKMSLHKTEEEVSSRIFSRRGKQTRLLHFLPFFNPRIFWDLRTAPT